MIGCRLKGNDLYVFFENDEIKISENKKVSGAFINIKNPSIRGVLEAILDDSIKDLISSTATADEKGNLIYVDVRFRKGMHEKLRNEGIYESHDGWRHVHLIDAKRMKSLSYQMVYGDLKDIMSK